MSPRRWFVYATIVFLQCMGIAHASVSSPDLLVMPTPEEVTHSEGMLHLDSGFSVEFQGYSEPRLARARVRFLAALSAKTGITVWQPGRLSPRLRVITGGPSKPVQQVGEDESYILETTSAGATLRAATPLGTMHGFQTFLQLVSLTPQGFAIPNLIIHDAPRLPWRGLLLDTSRHFLPLDVIRRNLDGMEAVKLNVFHWHLSDDQGFRAESHVYPLLQQKGSDGMYYTQREMREIVVYARDRGIRVVPELDMPGHVGSWLVGYPGLASRPGHYEIERRWGVFDPALDPSKENVYRFIDRLIGDISQIFPDAYFHIGGDECNGKSWDSSPRIQRFMSRQGLKTDSELQGYFSGRVQALVMKHGKIPIGWDEALLPSTPKNVVIQSWHGPGALATAARQGNRVLLSKGYYLNLNFHAEDYYKVDPLDGAAKSLMPEEQKRIIGGEASMWMEPATYENIDSRIWPVCGAIAQKLWSPIEKTMDSQALYPQLISLGEHLRIYGLQHQNSYSFMLQRIAANHNTSGLKVLGDVVEPLKGHDRAKYEQLSVFTALNRMADAVPPESMTARNFERITARISSGAGTEDDRRTAYRWLEKWRNNDAKLQPILPQQSLTSELIPLSRALYEVSLLGLEAMDHLERHTSVSATWQKNSLAKLKAAEEPRAAVQIAVVGAVERLVLAVPLTSVP